ncbi:UNVERIFIED_CONTAM: hypothetical protein GTU68_025759 [Idotea baltica]|nr:hypothetical protein [Idotea baltica]
MTFNLLITGAIYSSQASYSALQFCQAAIAGGHTISQVFFYQDGVTHGSSLSVPLADEFDSVAQWQEMAAQNGIDLVVCVSAAERRGVLNQQQAEEHERDNCNLHPSFSVAGLGELHAASLESDRTVCFK